MSDLCCSCAVRAEGFDDQRGMLLADRFRIFWHSLQMPDTLVLYGKVPADLAHYGIFIGVDLPSLPRARRSTAVAIPFC